MNLFLHNTVLFRMAAITLAPKLLLVPRSWSFHDWVPKLELGNQRVADKEQLGCSLPNSGLRGSVIRIQQVTYTRCRAVSHSRAGSQAPAWEPANGPLQLSKVVSVHSQAG